MISNGNIVFLAQSAGGGFDANHNPLPVASTPSASIVCNIKRGNARYQYLEDGEYKQAAFSVTVDSSLLTEIDLDIVTEVTISDAGGYGLGTHRIKQRQKASLTNSTQILL